MKLTPELIAARDSYLNPLKDREIDLRGLKLPAIENLGVTRDQVDTLDLSDNDILTLGNFPHLDRLAHLLLSNNLVSRIEPRIAFSLPRLTTLVLTNNQIASFAHLAPLGRFPMLQYLSLIGNPIAREKYYREWVVWKCKSLRVLDFRRIKDKVSRAPVVRAQEYSHPPFARIASMLTPTHVLPLRPHLCAYRSAHWQSPSWRHPTVGHPPWPTRSLHPRAATRRPRYRSAPLQRQSLSTAHRAGS